MSVRSALIGAVTMWMGVSLISAQPAQPVQPAQPPRPAAARPPAQVRLPEGVQALRNQEYAKVNGKSLLLDLYVPRTDKPLPLLVWIHGGAWKAGSKDQCPALVFTAHGYVVASVEYRFSQEAIFPAQIYDCKAAIRWLRANAAKYHIDPDHVGAWGASAGGHLVALLGTSGGVKELEGDEGNLDQSSRVQAVCDWFGPVDFLTIQEQANQNPFSRLEHNSPKSPESELIGGPMAENKDKAAKASATTYVGKDAPPFLIMHGDNDPLVPPQQSQELRDALQKAGADSTLEIVKGAGHGFGGPPINKMVADFFERTLKGKRQDNEQTKDKGQPKE